MPRHSTVSGIVARRAQMDVLLVTIPTAWLGVTSATSNHGHVCSAVEEWRVHRRFTPTTSTKLSMVTRTVMDAAVRRMCDREPVVSVPHLTD